MHHEPSVVIRAAERATSVQIVEKRTRKLEYKAKEKKEINCYACGQEGHVQSRCPDKWNRAVKDRPQADNVDRLEGGHVQHSEINCIAGVASCKIVVTESVPEMESTKEKQKEVRPGPAKKNFTCD